MNIGDMLFIEEEQNRINPGIAQGEQSIMVQKDMKQWGVENGMWPNLAYWKIVYDHAVARGWTQEGFTGMEVY
jgi:hypothetical protein